MDDLYRRRLEQLRKYAEWEEAYGPDGKKKTHICEWAAREIEALLKENLQLRRRSIQVDGGYQPVASTLRPVKPPRTL